MTATNDDRSVDYGTEMTLSCNTSRNWKTCTWQYHGKLCQFEYAYNTSGQNELGCDGYPDIKMDNWVLASEFRDWIPEFKSNTIFNKCISL